LGINLHRKETPANSRINEMNLASLNPEQIVPELQSTDHLEVISELVDLLFDYLEHVQHTPLPETIKEDTFAALRQREEKISTGIGSGVAIPHAFSEDIEEMAVIFGRGTLHRSFPCPEKRLSSPSSDPCGNCETLHPQCYPQRVNRSENPRRYPCRFRKTCS